MQILNYSRIFVSFMASPPIFLDLHVKFLLFAAPYILRKNHGSKGMRTEDGSIIYECLNGKPQAFGVLVDKYREGIYAFVYAELRDFQDAQDVTQEVFLQAYRDLRSLKRRESFAFWLYRIAHRRCLQCCRDRSRRIDRDFIEDQDPRAVDVLSLDSYRKSQMDESVREALDSLPDAYREVLVLHYFGGMTIKDMARAMGVSPGAIGMRLSRARAQLREEMVAIMDEAFEGQRLPVGFTFRIVEAAKRIKIHPMPRMAGLPWGLSLAVVTIMTVISLNPHLNISSDIAIPAGSSLPVETKALKTGEIPVDILRMSEISVISSKQADGSGGEPQFQTPQNAFFMAPHDQGGKWARKADMPTPRGALSTSVVNGKIYAIGGGINMVCITAVEEYDPATDKWTKKANMPTARGGHIAGVVNGKIYVIGGGRAWSDPISTVEEYDPATGKWTKKADMPTAREMLCGGVVNGKIYAIGGERSWGNALSTVEEYDPATDKWTKKADMPTARAWLSAAALNGKIYVVGGHSGDVTFLSRVEVYDPATDTWEERADTPIARNGLSTCAAGGKIYTVGGYLKGDIVISIVDEYDPLADKWTSKADMLTARQGLSTSVMGGKIYAIGGNGPGPGTPISAVEEYDPGSAGESVEAKGKLPTKWGEVKQ